MAIFSQYGTGQRVGFLIVCLAFCFCLIGSIAPYWITAETSFKDVNFVGDVINDFGLGDVTLFKVRIGVWYYCVDWNFEDKCYSLYDTSDYHGPDPDKDRFAWINVARFCVIVNILMSLIAGLIACCRCLCCSGGRTICHGVLSFFAGAFGICAFVVVEENTKSLLNIPIVEVETAWAYGLYALGSVMMVIASFVLCVAVPRENNYGIVVANPTTPGVSVNVTNSNSMVNQYNAGGPIQSFEPLPNVVGPPQAAPGPYPGPYNNPPPHYTYAAAAGQGTNHSSPGYGPPTKQ